MNIFKLIYICRRTSKETVYIKWKGDYLKFDFGKSLLFKLSQQLYLSNSSISGNITCSNESNANFKENNFDDFLFGWDYGFLPGDDIKRNHLHPFNCSTWMSSTG